MLIYVYDGYWEGLLTAVYEAYARHEQPDQIVTNARLAQSWLDQYVEITADSEKASKVARSIRRKISAMAEMRLDRVFRSDDPDKGTLIYHYLQLGYQYGPGVDNYLHENAVLEMHERSQRVNFEVHRFEGLMRFVRTDWGAFYAQFSPDHHITDLLAPHFARRLSDQNWIIHDTKRQIAALYNQKEWILTDQMPELLTASSYQDQQATDLWKIYFQNITITERVNPRLQRQMMPVRYWQNLPEMSK
ncbi:MAG: TIGR03915 family putative DNA repair protein [Eubacteriales bacterium]|nr:TIGR03915 family putative DNA repair protein [Eubacteriales bacterium]